MWAGVVTLRALKVCNGIRNAYAQFICTFVPHRVCIHNNFSFDIYFYPFSLRSGVYKVYINDKHISTYNHTGLFGELALLYNMPR